MADLTFTIASDTTPFDNAVRRGVIKPLEDSEKALEEFGRTGDREIGDLEDGMRDASRDTERFEESIKDVRDALTRVGRDGKRGLDDVKDGTRDARQGMDDLKDEANSTAREAAASFDGSAESIGDAFQEVAANAFAGFGPAGAVAGLAAAVGLGAAMTAITDQQEAADELKRRLTEAYIAAADEGRNYLTVQQIMEESAAIYRETEGRLKQATEDALKLNIDRALVVQAMAGDEDAINAVIAAGNDLVEEGTARMREKADAGKNIIDYQTAETATLETIVQRYQDQLGLQDQARTNAQEYLDIVTQQKEKESEGNAESKRAWDERGRQLQAYADRLASIPNPVVTPQIDLAPAEAAIKRFTTGDGKRLTIVADVVDRNGRMIQ